MTEAQKQWICEKAGVGYQCPTHNPNDNSCIYGCPINEYSDIYCTREITLEILMKAVWAINGEGKYFIQESRHINWKKKMFRSYQIIEDNKGFEQEYFIDKNQNEIQTIKKALCYIADKEAGNG